MRQQGEPSVEEILDSIKKVIASDNRVARITPRMVSPEAEAAPRAAEQNAGGSRDDVLDLAMSARYLDAHDEENGDDGDPALLGEEARSSMRQSLAALAMMAQPSAQPQIVRQGETSLEGLTRELLRPLLADWLDEHLPGMVEQMVSAEIARIVGKKA